MQQARRSPSVSVVLPVFNGEAYLHACLESAVGQTATDFELLVGDDASTDSSAAIIESFRDARIRYTRRTTRLGLFANLNQLIDESQAPLLRFLCQDDELEPTCLEDEIAFLGAHPEVPMSFSKSTGVNERGVEVSRDELDDLPDVLSPSLTWQQFLYHGCIPGNLSTVCARRNAVARVGGFDASFIVAGDYDLWVRLCADAALGIVRKHLVRLRRHPGQLSRSPGAGVEFVRENRRVQAALWPRVPRGGRRRARTYMIARNSVLDVHYLLRCLFRGRVAAAGEVARVLGLRDVLGGLLFWLGTLNNRLYRPRAPFDEAADSSASRGSVGRCNIAP